MYNNFSSYICLASVVGIAFITSAIADGSPQWFIATNSHPIHLKTDVCVYGGTSAGIAAAVQAARMGKHCVLVTPEKRLGGLTSNGLGWTDVGNANAIGGLAREFYHLIYLHYSNSAAWTQEPRAAYIRHSSLKPDENRQLMFTFEPKVAVAIFDQLLAESHVTIIHGQIMRPGGVKKNGARINEIVTQDGKVVIRAMEFIDASYEGDLLAEAGVSYTVGREGKNKYDEPLAGIQTAQAKKNQLVEGINPFVIPGNTNSGLLSGVAPNAGGADSEKDKCLQAYCYRMCLTDVASNCVMISKPPNYNEADFQLLFRALTAGQKDRFFKTSPMPNRKTDSNNDSGFSTDFIGGNYNLSEGWNYVDASYIKRKEILEAHRNFQMGLVWTLQNHPRVPAEIRKAWSKWGLPLDEFTGNDHWPAEIYVREARRMVSDFVITQHEVDQEPGHIASDPVGMGGYNMDSHNVQRYVTTNGFVQNEGDLQSPPAHGPYGISYRALVPSTNEVENLLTPTCVSASHIAFGSIRMEPVFMILGQSAGAAAVLAMEDKVPVQRVDYKKLRVTLLTAGQILPP